jgi:hypothetical protein
MAGQVDVPPQDITQGRAPPDYEAAAAGDAMRLLRIRNSKTKPADAYAAVYCRDHWFWIDDRDLKSKRVFAFMMLLFTLAETGEKEELATSLPSPHSSGTNRRMISASSGRPRKTKLRQDQTRLGESSRCKWDEMPTNGLNDDFLHPRVQGHSDRTILVQSTAVKRLTIAHAICHRSGTLFAS